MRIAHFIDTDCKGGAEVTLMDLCAYQHRAGHNVIVIHRENDFLEEACKNNGIEQAVIPGYRLYKSAKTLPLYAIALARTLSRLRVEVLHSHLFGPVIGNALSARLCGVKHVGTLHDVYTIEEKPARIKLIALSRWLGTRLVCVSEHMNEFYRARLGGHSDRLVTIYNGAHSPVTPPTAQLDALKRRYGIRPQERVLIAVGRLVPLKRFHLVIEAISALPSPDLKLLIAGEGPERENLKQLTKSLKVEDRVIFTGQVAAVPDLLYLADIFVLFSNTEGLSRSIIEAMSCKLPCVVSDVGGNRELVENGTTGYVMPPDRTDLLEECLAGLLGDQGLRQSFGERAYARYKQYFDYERFQKAYLRLYSLPSS